MSGHVSVGELGRFGSGGDLPSETGVLEETPVFTACVADGMTFSPVSRPEEFVYRASGKLVVGSPKFSLLFWEEFVERLFLSCCALNHC